MRYNKLVRDKIPKIIKENNQLPKTHTANQKEYEQKLKDKLREEVEEFLEDSNEEELADILEVIYAICDLYEFDISEIDKIRKNKADKRGAFKQKIILDEVTESSQKTY